LSTMLHHTLFFLHLLFLYIHLLLSSTTHTVSFLFFFNDTPPTEIYTLSLHDALPICRDQTDVGSGESLPRQQEHQPGSYLKEETDRKSTRLNSSHVAISYAVFCLKKKKK